MSMSVTELRRWVNTLDKRDYVGIDEGGLCLISVMDPEVYLEIGGVPEDQEEDE